MKTSHLDCDHAINSKTDRRIPKTHLLRYPALLLLLLFFAQTPALAKDNWIAVRSKNFNLIGNASEKDIKQVATKLEQFREVFSQLFPRLALSSPVPMTVIVFKSDSSYKPYKPVVDGKVSWVAGYFQHGQDVNYITLTTETRSEDPFRTIFHEYVHLLVNNAFGKASVPPWFNEGLAEYYSTFAMEDAQKVFLGKTIDNHILLLRSNKLIPLSTLFAVDNYSLLRNKHDTTSMFYAQSWALIHYLIQSNNGQRQPLLAKFLDRVIKNIPAETALKEVFQMDYAALEKELRKYIDQSTFRMNVVTFTKKLEFESEMQSSPMTDPQALAYLGDLLLHTDRVEEAITKLNEALALDPNLSMAHASMGMALMRQKNFVEARQHLAKAVGESPNYLAHYYYAYVLSREGMDQQDMVHGYSAETARKMRAELKTAIELKPDFAESYRLAAFVNFVTDENLDEAVTLLNKASSLSPGNEVYTFELAQVYLRKQDFAAARKMVEPLASTSNDQQVKMQAQNLLNSITSYQEQVARSASAEASFRAHESVASDGTRTQPTEEVRETNPWAALEEALRKPEDNEKRLQGVLTGVECSPRGIVFAVKVANQLLKFSAKNLDEVDFTTYTPDVAGELTCGLRKQLDPVVVIYKPGAGAKATEGQIVSLEFVPKDFILKQKSN